MQFRLEKQTTGPNVTRFHVLNTAGEACGIITVPNNQAADLQKHWHVAPAPAAKQPDRAAALAKAIMAAKQPMTASKLKAAVLRGS
jgi:hypothetical protein